MKTLLKGLLANFGYELKRIKKIPERIVDIDDSIKCRKINYACGNVCMEGWLNVDGFNRSQTRSCFWTSPIRILLNTVFSNGAFAKIL